MIKILASKKMSLFCFVINCIFAVAAWTAGDSAWFLFSGFFALLCLYNYNNTSEN